MSGRSFASKSVAVAAPRFSLRRGAIAYELEAATATLQRGRQTAAEPDATLLALRRTHCPADGDGDHGRTPKFRTTLLGACDHRDQES